MELKISRILHAGYLFEYDGVTIAFDPLFESPFSRNCFAFPEVDFDLKHVSNLKIDAIFISHYHDDHFSLDSLKLLDRSIPIYFFTLFDELILILKKMGFQKVYSIDLMKTITVGPFELKALKALDEEVDSIYHIRIQDINILNVVDSWIGPQTLGQLIQTKWDLVLWPFQTMREIEVIAPSVSEPISSATLQLPTEWLEQIRLLQPRALVPSSCQFRFEDWSWYNHAFFPISYKQFRREILNILPDTEIWQLSPGESILLRNTKIKKGPRLSWINPIADQNVDYAFDPEIIPQPISEIAKKFPPLTFDQKQLIQSYCEVEILRRFQSLADLGNSFSWKLIIYDHQGQSQAHLFKINQNRIEKTDLVDSWDWITEISESKLLGALSEGESLTSIYIRVTPIKSADPLEDPLIRCLYEGALGSYQKAQLKKILSESTS